MIVNKEQLDSVRKFFISLSLLGIVIPMKCRLISTTDDSNEDMRVVENLKWKILPKENI